MTIPPEIAWLVPIIIPFIIGVLIGAVIKKGLKLLIFVALLIIVLVFTGIITLSFNSVYYQAMQFLPKLYDTGHAVLNMLPYSSLGFIIGLIIGFILA